MKPDLTQVELAKKAGVTARTIQNYELGNRKPVHMEVVQKIADALGTTTEYLLGSSGAYVAEAHEKGGAKAARDIDELVSEVTGLFAGGNLSEEALEGAMKALNDAYWIAKEKNKKYAPRRKYRKRKCRRNKSVSVVLVRSVILLFPTNGGGAMTAAHLSKVGSDLVRRCGTRDPFRIARELGIEVLVL